ncbi:MAG: hypothetical protein OEN55_08795 [Alphaproteobacteria bacterium]|nr:hypothetical protein [Alphaproteobacteria bacterium]
MTKPLNRDEIIALLERLGGDDAEVLEAARALHAAVAAAGTKWDDLLVPEDAGDARDTDTEVDEPADAGDADVAEVPAETEIPAAKAGRDANTEVDEPADAGADDVADVPADAEIPAAKAGRDAKALSLIKKLLARPGITDSFREEMEGYKADIAGGAFTDADHKYLRALAKRLSGKG